MAVPGTVIITPSEECLLGFGLVWYLDNDIEALYRMTVKPLLKQALCGGITYQSPRNLLPMFIQRSSLLGGRGHPLGFSFG